MPYLSERFSRILVSWLLITILSFFCSSLSHALDDPWVRDTVRLEISDGQVPGPPATAQVKIPVIFVHDTNIVGFVVPLFWAGALFLDSVVFSPSVKEHLGFEKIEIYNAEKKVLITAITEPEPDLAAGTYTMGYLYFAPQDTGAAVIDTCFMLDPLLFADNTGVWTPEFIRAEFTISELKRVSGDADQNGAVEIADVVFLINYLFRDGNPPDPVCSCDVNTDCSVSLADIVYLINYLFRSGPEPLGNCYPCS